MIWLTADTHLGHENILRYRPFDSIKRMDRYMIDAINDMVAPSDELYVLGDFSFRVPREDVRRYRWLLRCNNVHLVRGNHDMSWNGEWHGCSPFQSERDYFDGVHSPRPNRHRIVMCHYPLMSWRSMDYGSIHAHGHMHADMGYNERNRDAGVLMYDVGVDANGFRPVSLEQLAGFFSGIEPRRRHHMRDEVEPQ